MENKSGNTIQAFWVLLGSLSAFSFAIISSMLLSRYFDKNEYGTYRQVMYVYNSLIVVFTLGLPNAYSYFLPKLSDGEAKDFISKLNFILLGLGGIMSLVLFGGAGVISGFLKNNELALPLRFFALVPLFMLPTMGLEGIMSTYRKTFFLAIYNIATKIFMLLCVVVPVIFFKGNVVSAIIGFTFASFLCFLLALFLKNWPVRKARKVKSCFSYRDILEYTIPLMGASIWGIIINSSDQFFISRYFGREVFADFANGSLELPIVSMVIASTATVLTPVFVRKVHFGGDNFKDEIIVIWKSVLSKTVKIIYPVVAFCFCFADMIIAVLYGEQYRDSAYFFQIKLIVNFFTVMTYGPLLFAINGQKFYYNVHMYGALILIALELFSVYLFESPYLISVISVLCQIGRVVVMFCFVANYFKITPIKLFPYSLVANILVPSIVLLIGIRYFLMDFLRVDNKGQILLFSFLLYSCLYSVWVLYRKIDYYSIFRPLLSKIK